MEACSFKGKTWMKEEERAESETCQRIKTLLEFLNEWDSWKQFTECFLYVTIDEVLWLWYHNLAVFDLPLLAILNSADIMQTSCQLRQLNAKAGLTWAGIKGPVSLRRSRPSYFPQLQTARLWLESVCKYSWSFEPASPKRQMNF